MRRPTPPPPALYSLTSGIQPNLTIMSLYQIKWDRTKIEQIQKKAPTVEPVYGQFPMYRQNSHKFPLKKNFYNTDLL